MIGAVFGKNYDYGGAKSIGSLSRYTALRLNAFTMSNAGGILDQAIQDRADLDAFYASTRQSNSSIGKFVNIFA